MTEETYIQHMKCGNCGHSYIEDFPKGTTVRGLHLCPNCGCSEAKATGKPNRPEEHYQL